VVARTRRAVDRRRAPPDQRAGDHRGDARVIPGLRLHRARCGVPRALRAVHDPPRRVEHPGGPAVDGQHAAHPGQSGDAGARLPAGAATAQPGRGRRRFPGGGDLLLLHRAAADAGVPRPGPGDRRARRTPGGVGLPATVLRGGAAARTRLDPQAPGRSRLRPPVVRREGRRPDRAHSRARARADPPARGRAAAAAPPPPSGRGGHLVPRPPRRARPDPAARTGAGRGAVQRGHPVVGA
jgi:hypothetical protein